MPANPKAVAIQKAVAVQRNFEAAQRLYNALRAERNAAVLRCLEAGCSQYEVADLFGVSRSLVQQWMRAAS